jgi:hypothetical protein
MQDKQPLMDEMSERHALTLTPGDELMSLSVYQIDKEHQTTLIQTAETTARYAKTDTPTSCATRLEKVAHQLPKRKRSGTVSTPRKGVGRWSKKSSALFLLHDGKRVRMANVRCSSSWLYLVVPSRSGCSFARVSTRGV